MTVKNLKPELASYIKTSSGGEIAVVAIHEMPNYLRIENAEGYVFIAVYLFIYLYACSSHN